MNFEIQKAKVYVLLDENNRVLRCEGGYSIGNIDDMSKWTCVDEGDGDRYNLCQHHYFGGGLLTSDGILRWKYVDGACVLRSEDELDTDRATLPTPQPSQLDRLEAQVTYTAMMTDTLMGG